MNAEPRRRGRVAAGESHRRRHQGAPAGGHAVAEVDLPGLGDGRALVEIHQLVEGAEPLGPQVVLAARLPHHLEVLHVALVPDGRRTDGRTEDEPGSILVTNIAIDINIIIEPD